jgi:GTP-binding protein
VEPTPADQTDPVHNYLALRHELQQYNPELAERPEIVAVTKAELPAAADVHERLQAKLRTSVLLISAVTGQNLNHLIGAIKQQLDNLRSVEGG